ncbi:endocuticle structural glycoprotein SgAbd-5-like [Choristoneura fumiferana]|uniref:endocuticle structural glycoprotein SgAbd-5-like n=1 Tax=Choristoneura fumiferana TaxID=7141 RepID=UPI003D15A702
MFPRVINVMCIGICLCYAAPTSKDDAEARILEYDNENDGSGNYYFRYVTSNGIKREENGTVVNGGQPGAYIEVKGTTSYIDSNGEEIVVQYTADDQGYHINPSNVFYPAPELAVAVSPLIVASLLGGG